MKDFSQLISDLSSLTLDESQQLVTDLENIFGVKAVSPAQNVQQTFVPTVTNVEKTEFEVFLAAHGAQKVQVIKLVRELLGLSLKDAKDLVDATPKSLKEGVGKAEAESIKEKIEAVGGVVELR